jgi:type VI secretion system secreted protein VgrG
VIQLTETELMALDIRTGVLAAVIIIGLLAILFIWQGFRSIRSARKLPFFRMRRERMLRGWRLLLGAIFLAVMAVLLNSQAEPLIYRYFPPTATVTLTPTITVTPTITLTPTISLTPTVTPTPAVTDTPTITPTPFMPLAIESVFTSTVTPNPDAIFSEITFSNGIDENYIALNPNTIFQNPVGHMYGLFSYDGMIDGSQWTALWYRDGELVHFETLPWNGGTGGLGYTDWEPRPEEWIPGEYEVQIFTGLIWQQSGRFTVEGDAPTAAPTETPTRTPTTTPSVTPTRTLIPTQTPIPSRTPRPTSTITLTPTITLTRTPYLSPTLAPSITPWPTMTKSPVTPSITPWPTVTPIPTRTRAPTFTPAP